MKNLIKTVKKNLKDRRVFAAFFAAVAVLCFISAFAFGGGLFSVAADSTEKSVVDEIAAAPEYSGEKVIEITGELNMDGTNAIDDTYVIKTGKKVRFKGDDTAKLTFSKNLVIEEEAIAIFDVETEFAQNITVTVNGTLEIRGRLLNNAALNVQNGSHPNAEIPSEGVVIYGSLNNDAANGGSIVLGATADGEEVTGTIKTQANEDTYTATDGTQTALPGGGALMLKNSDATLGLAATANSKIKNSGSVIYGGDTAPAISEGNSAVKATFAEASQDILTKSGTYVVYGDTATVSSATTLNGLNLMAFGKVTFKLSGSNNFTVEGATSLGGGEQSSGRYYTHGANELIFDGGAVWTPIGAPEYGNISSGTTIFYDENNSPYIYDNDGNIGSSSSAFFNVTGGTFALFDGAKITNYEMPGGSNIGGAVKIGSGLTLDMWGGEVSQCAVAESTNQGTGGGIYTAGGTLNIYGGKVTNNAVSSYNQGSADGAGISVDNDSKDKIEGCLNLYGGEISYNHGAVGITDAGADGGGIMVRYSTANIYGGEVRGNFAGGSGGGICAWDSSINMKGGEIVGNRAAFGGGISAVSDGDPKSTAITISGGKITGNEAFQHYNTKLSDGKLENKSGYGGGVCVGSDLNPYYSTITISENAEISDNRAYYGGGLAVFTQNNPKNQLIMQGGIISGNAAYQTNTTGGYNANFVTPLSENGGGVYAYNKETYTSGSSAMIVLSGNASIDSSNSVSVGAAEVDTSAPAPISVDGTLGGSGLGALVFLGNDLSKSQWSGKKIISFNSNAAAKAHLNKFILDPGTSTDKYAFTVSGTDNYISYASSAASVAKVTGDLTDTYSSLDDAFKAIQNSAGTNFTLEIMQSCTVSSPLSLTGNKNLTIMPTAGQDITVALASNYSGTTGSLFSVTSGSSLTFSTTDTSGERLTFDGNGTGRRLANSQTDRELTLISLDGGKAVRISGNIYLRNNRTTGTSSAVYIGTQGGKFTINRGVIENNVSTQPNGSAVYIAGGSFTMTNAKIQNNTTEYSSADGTTYNYGIFLSEGSLTMDGETGFGGNTLRASSAPNIVLGSSFEVVGDKIGLVLPSRNNLTGGTNIIRVIPDSGSMGQYFYIANADEGISLNSVRNTSADSGTYKYNLVLYKTVTYLLDTLNATGIPAGATVTVGDEAAIQSIITAYSQNGVTVKTRNGGRVFVITLPYGGTSASLTALSEFFTVDGYSISSWESATSSLKYTYENALPYAETSNDYIRLNAIFTANTYKIIFNAQAPDGTTVSGTMADYVLGADTSATLTLNAFVIKGYAFTGWTVTANGQTVNIANSATVSSIDLKLFDKSSHGNYVLNVYAAWQSLFESGVGTSANPFVIANAEQLTNLKLTVNGQRSGDGKIVNLYYNETNGGTVSYAPDGYSGYYFRLDKDIEGFAGGIGVYSATDKKPFSGNFTGLGVDGAIHKITLSGSGLFGYLNGAQVTNLDLSGSVSGAVEVGALACRAVGATISGVSSIAQVSGTGNRVGGILGYGENVLLSDCYNTGSVSGAYEVGGIFGAFEGSSAVSNVLNSGAVTANGYETVTVGSASVQIAYAGGIIGRMTGTSARIESAFNSGSVTAANGGGAGGIIGGTGTKGKNIQYVYNTGAISAKYIVGGISGYLSNSTVMSAFNGGNVTATGKISFTIDNLGYEKSFVGAVAGLGVSDTIYNNVYFNIDKAYNGSTDAGVKALGDAEFVSGKLHMGASSDHAVALTSSKMFVPLGENDEGTTPAGFDQLFNTSDRWSYVYVAGDNLANQFYYYPQLAAFAENERQVGGMAIKDISLEGAKLYVPAGSGGDDKPITGESSFKVYFNLEGGTISDNSLKMEDGKYFYEITFKLDGEQSLVVPRPANPVKTGYTFIGWFTESGDEYDFGSGVSAKDITLSAHWEKTQYQFVYGFNGGLEYNTNYAKFATLDGGKIVLATGETASNYGPSNADIYRNGYNFTGWTYTYSSGGTSLEFKVEAIEIETVDGVPQIIFYYENAPLATTVPLSSITDPATAFRFNAGWKERDYKITYTYIIRDGDGNETEYTGTGVTNPNIPAGKDYSEYTYSSSDEHVIQSATLPGYWYEGWFIKNNADEYVSYNSVPRGTYGDRHVYGIFTPHVHEITFNPRELGSISDTKLTHDASRGIWYTTVEYGSDIRDLAGIEATRTGYDFAFWSTNATATADKEEEFKFNFTTPYSVDQATALYAVYTDLYYDVTVSAGEGTFQTIELGFTVPNASIVGTPTDKAVTLSVKHGNDIYAALYALQAKLTPPTGQNFISWNDSEGNALTGFTITAKGFAAIAAYSATDVTVIFTNDYLDGNNYEVFRITHHTALSAEQWTQVTALSNASVTGYTFKRWVLAGMQTVIEVGETTVYTESRRVVAEYEPVSVKVKFDIHDPCGNDDVSAPTIEENYSLKYNRFFGDVITVPKYSGYRFTGWTAMNAAEQEVTVSSVTAVSSVFNELNKEGDYYVITLTAGWDPISYNITYNVGDATWANGYTKPSQFTYEETYGDGFTIPLTFGDDNAYVLTRKGYTLTGWTTASGAELEGNKLSEGLCENISLSPIWDRNTYTVTFSALDTDGSGNKDGYFTVPAGFTAENSPYFNYEEDNKVRVAAGGQAKYYETTVRYLENASAPVLPARLGYDFKAWTVNYQNVESDLQIFATYGKHTYTLYLSANGGSFGADKNKTLPVVFETEVDLSALVKPDAREGYTFKGWATEETATAAITSYTMPAEDDILYAVWTANVYNVTITFENGITDSVKAYFADDKYDINETAKTVKFKAEHGEDLSYLNSRPSETEGGVQKVYIWYQGGAVYAFGLIKDDLEIRATTVVDTTNTAKVTLYLNYGETFYEFPYKPGDPVQFPEVNRPYYSFAGWYDSAVGGNRVDKTEVTAQDGAEYYAHWTATEYTVSLNYDGGEGGSTQVKYTVETQSLSLPTATRTGYMSLGWFESGATVEFEYAQGTTVGDKFLTAKWQKKKYKITVSNFTENALTPNQTSKTFEVEYGDSVSKELAGMWLRNYYDVSLVFKNETTRTFEESTQATVRAFDEVSAYAGKFSTVDGETGVYETTLTAIYDAKEYRIYYESTILTDVYDFTTRSFVPSVTAEPKEGNTFKGWSVVVNGEFKEIDSLSVNLKDSSWVVELKKGGIVVSTVPMGTEIHLYPVFETTTYTVEFDADGGEGTMTEQTFVYGVTTKINANEFTKAGHVFAGWYKAKKVGETLTVDESTIYPDLGAIVFKETLKNGESLVLVAQWTPITYKINFDAKGGTITGGNLGENDSILFVYSADGYFAVPIGDTTATWRVSKTGYTFKGWKLGDTTVTITDGNKVKFEIPATGTQVTLEADWEVITYNIVYDLGLGDENPTATYDVATNGGKLTIYSGDKLVKQGYTFGSWSIGNMPINETAEIILSNYFNRIEISADNKITFTANWTANSFTVEFNANGGEGTMLAQSFTYGEKKALTKNAFTRTGYTFVGWKHEDKQYTDGQLVQDLTTVNGGTVTLYAVWNANKYKVEFNANGGVGTMVAQSFTYGENKALTQNAFTRTGYTFGGWAITALGAEVYEDEQEVENLSGVNGGTVTLYAVWNATEYTVKTIDGDTTTTVETLSFGGMKSVTLPELTNVSGYSNVGWLNGGVTYTGTLSLDSIIGLADANKVITFTASRTAITYFITYERDGGAWVNGGTGVKTSYTVKDNEYEIPDVGKTGYNFLGWYTDAAFASDKVTEITEWTAGGLTLYAKFTPIAFNITVNAGKAVVDGVETQVLFDKNDENSYSTTLDMDYGSDIFSQLFAWQMKILSPYTNNNFYQWTVKDKDGNSVALPSYILDNSFKDFIILQTDGNIVSYSLEITATYLQGAAGVTLLYADGNIDTEIYEYSASTLTYVAPKLKPVDGYSNRIWIYYGSENETAYSPIRITSSIMLQEVATGNTYTVKFGANGGDGTMTEQSFIYGDTQNLTKNAFTRTGYTFVGWATSAGGAVVYADGEAVKNLTDENNGTFTLYAVWQAITYNVAFNLDGGSGNVLSQTVKFGGTENITLGTAAKTGYLFLGWKVGENTYTASATLSQVVSGADENNVITFTAQWQKVNYVVYVDGVKAGESTVDGTLTLQTPAARAGYIFLGWALKDRDGVLISANDGQSNVISRIIGAVLAPEAAEVEVKLVLMWSEITYTLTYDRGGHGVQPSSVTLSYREGAINKVTLPVLSELGYNFIGWYNTDGEAPFTGEKSLGDLIGYADGNNTIRLTAKWSEPVVYKITFKGGGGKIHGAEEISVECTVLDELSVHTAVRNGYNFTNWRIEGRNISFTSDITVELLIPYAQDIGGVPTVTLVADWSNAVIYTITYENLYGSAHGNRLTYTIETDTFNLLNAADREYYNFEGWYLDEECTQRVTAINKGSFGNKTLYANWINKTYAVTVSVEGWVYGSSANAPVIYVSNNGNVSFVQVAYARLGENARDKIGQAVGEDWITEQGNPEFGNLPSYPGAGVYAVRAYFAIDGVKSSEYAYFVFEIQKQQVKAPAFAKDGDGHVLDEFTYTGGEIKAEISGYNTSVMISESVRTENGVSFVSGTDARTYTVTVRLQDTDNYVFTGGGAECELVWKINPAEDDEIFIVDLPGATLDGDNKVSALTLTYGTELSYVVETAYGAEVEFYYKPVAARVRARSASPDADGWYKGLPEKAGNYIGKIVSAGSGNVANTPSMEFPITVNKRDLFVTVNGTGIYGDNFADGTFGALQFSGFVADDTANCITIGKYVPVLSGARSANASVGTYPLTLQTENGNVVGISSENYNIIVREGEFEIMPRPVTLTIGSAQSVYASALYELNNADNLSGLVRVTGGNLAAGDSLSALGIILVTTATTNSDAGGYSIRIKEYSNGNYDISSTDGVYTVTALPVSVVFNRCGGTYGDVIPAAIEDLIFTGTAEDKIAAIKSELKGALSVTYTGTDNDGNAYHSSNVPVLAGTYVAVAALDTANDNYKLSDLYVNFIVARAADGLSSELEIEGWTYGRYSADVNAPKATVVSGSKPVFTYSRSANSGYTSAVPSNWDAGEYYVRVETEASANYLAFASAPVKFSISTVKLAAPTLTLVSEGEGRNDTYTGAELKCSVNGFNASFMSVAYDGALIDGNNVTIVATNAGKYKVKFSLTNTVNYDFETGEDTVELEWVIKKMQLAVPKQATEDIQVTGMLLEFFPEGFDARYMSISDNVSYFGGSFKSVVSIIDKDNFEWVGGSVEDLIYEWQAVGVSGTFIIIITVASSVAVAALAFAVVQYVMYRRKKRALETSVDERSARDAELEMENAENGGVDGNAEGGADGANDAPEENGGSAKEGN